METLNARENIAKFIVEERREGKGNGNLRIGRAEGPPTTPPASLHLLPLSFSCVSCFRGFLFVIHALSVGIA